RLRAQLSAVSRAAGVGFSFFARQLGGGGWPGRIFTRRGQLGPVPTAGPGRRAPAVPLPGAIYGRQASRQRLEHHRSTIAEPALAHARIIAGGVAQARSLARTVAGAGC